MAFLLNKLRAIFFNPISLVLVFLHWVVFIVFFPRQELFSDSFHLAHENIVTYLLILLDFPAFVMTVFVNYSITNEITFATYITAFVFITIQWSIVGYGINELFRRIRNKGIFAKLK